MLQKRLKLKVYKLTCKIVVLPVSVNNDEYNILHIYQELVSMSQAKPSSQANQESVSLSRRSMQSTHRIRMRPAEFDKLHSPHKTTHKSKRSGGGRGLLLERSGPIGIPSGSRRLSRGRGRLESIEDSGSPHSQTVRDSLYEPGCQCYGNQILMECPVHGARGLL